MLLWSMMPISALASVELVGDSFTVSYTDPADEPAETPTVQITFLDYDGATLGSAQINQGDSYPSSEWPAVSRSGYDFIGWHDGNAIITSLDNVQAGVTLTAQYVQLFTVTFDNWDGAVLYTVHNVRAGTTLASADLYGAKPNPTRDGYGFAAWEPAVLDSVSADMTVTATFSQLTQHTITINYVFENQQQAADPYVATVYDGYTFKDTVTSPEIMGYHTDQTSVSIEGKINEDKVILVKYAPNGDTPYQVQYLFENVDGQGYTCDESRTIRKTGRTGNMTEVGNADAITLAGFELVTNLDTCNDTIAADASTVIKLQYKREIHFVMFDTANGTYIEPQMGRYGMPVIKPNDPARIGYSFKGWNQTVPKTIGTADITLTAQWNAATVGYTIVLWRENANDSGYSYTATLENNQAKAGSTVNTYSGNYRDSESDYFKYGSCDSVVIEGDGSSVQNVYFTRNKYKAYFDLWYSSAYLNVGNKTYWGNSYSFEAKYDSDIAALWPTSVGPANYGFYGWSTSGISSTFTSKRLTFTPELLGRKFTANYGGWSYDTLIYMLETPDGSGISHQTKDGVTRCYAADDDLAQSVTSGGGTWGMKEISGFTGIQADQDTVSENPLTRTITLYYARSKASLTFHNGSAVKSYTDIYFGAKIEPYHYTPERPAGVADDFVFTGWYTDVALYDNTLLNWSAATMPKGGLILYSGWEKPVYTVNFNYNYEGAGRYQEQTVSKGDTADTLDQPVREGYQFDYWYYQDGGAEKLYTFSMPITHAYELYAHWTAVDVAYTVKYVDDKGNAVYNSAKKTIPAKQGMGKVGSLITENAVAANNKKGAVLYPDRVSSSITLQASGALNTITFIYTHLERVYYLVRYVDQNGIKLADDKGPFETSDATVTVAYMNINGYSPNRYQQTLVLAGENSPETIAHNIVTFVYTPNPKGSYTVEYYQQNLNDNGYTLVPEATQTFTDAPLGSTVYGEIVNFEGFNYVNGISTQSGVVYSSKSNPLVLRIYYNRNVVEYSASFLDKDTNEAIAVQTTGRARFGAGVTLLAKSVTGYTLDDTVSQPSVVLTLSATASANHVDFIYKLRNNIAVSIRYLDEANEPIANTLVLTSDDDRSIRLGATYRYTLPSSKETIVFNGETFHHLGAEATTQSLTVADSTAGNDNNLDYHFAPETYRIRLDANGGSNAPSDLRNYRLGASVTLPSGTPTYGEQHFEGWSEDVAVVGKIFTNRNDLSAVELIGDPYTMPGHDVTLYAVWSRITAAFSYACDTPYTGTLPAASLVDIGSSVSVASGSGIARAGYAFAGWKIKNESGQLTGPAYGTGEGMQPTLTVSAATTLYATWTALSYTVSYQNNLPGNASARWVNPNAVSSYTIETADLSLLDASCTGYTFLGWYADASTLATVPAIPQGSTGNRVFYALFSAAPLDGVRLDGFSGAYDGLVHGVTLVDQNSQLLESDEITYSTDNAYTNVTNGPVTVTATIRRDGQVVWTGSATVAITRRPLTLLADDLSAVYDGSGHVLSVDVFVGENGAATAEDAQAIQSALTFTMGGVAVPNSFINAMPATTVIVSATNDNYTITGASPTVTISKRPVSLLADSLSGIVYDGAEHVLDTFTVAAADDDTGLVGTDQVQTVLWTDNTRTDAGVSHPQPSDATMSVGKISNYAFEYLAGTLEIVQSDSLTVELSADSATFDGLAHGFTVDTNGETVTLEYRIGTGDWQTVTTDHPIPSYVNSGSYPVTVRASNPNYSNHPTATATLVIDKRLVTVTPEIANFLYDGAAHTAENYQTEKAQSDSLTGLIGTDDVTVTLGNQTHTDVGQYPLTCSDAQPVGATLKDNYTFQYGTALMSITQATGLGITLADDSVTYDGAEHTLGYSVNTPDGCDYTVSYRLNGGDWIALGAGAPLPGQSQAGAYAYEVQVTSPNYSDTGANSATLTIGRRVVRMEAQSTAETYTGGDVTVGYTVATGTTDEGLLEDDAEQVTLTGQTQTEAGNYTVDFDRTATAILRGTTDVTANYDIRYTAGTITIRKAQSASAATAIDYAYDGTAHAYTLPTLTSADGDELSNVTVAWSLTELAAEDAGWSISPLPTETEVKSLASDGSAESYTLYLRLTQPNYETKIVAATLTVTPAQVTLTADSRMDYPYTLLGDGTAKVWTIDTAHWQIAGLAQDALYAGDTITYQLGDNQQSAVDSGHDVTFLSYAVTEASHAKNYAISPVNGFIRVVQGTDKTVIAAQGMSFTYDAQAHPLPAPSVTVATATGQPVERTAAFTMSYEVTIHGSTVTTNTLPTFTDAGEYTVTLHAVSSIYATPSAVTVTVTVNRRVLTLTSETASYPYDAAEHEAAVLQSVQGLATGTAQAINTGALTLKAGQVNRATLQGLYPVEIAAQSVQVLDGTTDQTGNYAVSIVPGSLTITPRTVTAAELNLQDVNQEYDAQTHSVAMPEEITVNGQVIDLTDTSRFLFTYKLLDLTTVGALESDSATNPARIDVSSHRITVQITDRTGSLVFEAAQANLQITPRSVTITPDVGEFTYNGAEHAVNHYEMTGLQGSDQGTPTLRGNRRTLVGSNTITCLAPESLTVGNIANYRFTLNTGLITVTQATGLAVNATADHSVFDGQPHGYDVTVNETDQDSLTLEYSLDNENWTLFTSSDALPTYSNAGEYPLYLRASSDNFSNTATTSVTLTISPRSVAITPQSDKITYTGAPQTLTGYVTEKAKANNSTGLIGSDEVTVTLDNNTQTNAGEYTVTCANAQPVGPTLLSNYTFTYGTGTLTVTRATKLTITAEDLEVPYTGSGYTMPYTVNVPEGCPYTISYHVGSGGWITLGAGEELPYFTDIGTYLFHIKVESDNYTNVDVANVKLIIRKAALTLTVLDDSYLYDGQPHTLQVEATGLMGKDALTGYVLNPPSKTEPGVYSVTLNPGDIEITNPDRAGNLADNYTLTLVGGTMTIVDFTATGFNGVYNGQPHGVTTAVPDALKALYDVSYTYLGVNSAQSPTFVNAGTYVVTVALTPKSATSGLPTLTKDVSVMIAPKSIALQASGFNKTYDALPSSVTVSLAEGAAVNEADRQAILDAVTMTVNGVSVQNRFVNVINALAVVTSTNANYLIADAQATLRISQRPLTITAGQAARQYDETPLSVDYTSNGATYNGAAVTNATGLLRGHILSATMLDATQTDVCDQVPVTFDTALTTITESGVSVIDNYDISYVNGAITITRAESLALTLTPYQGVYDALAHGVSVASVKDGTRIVSLDQFTWTYGLSADAMAQDNLTRTDVTDLVVYVKGVSTDGNYPDVQGATSLTITARPVAITPASLSVIYDGTTYLVDEYSTEKATKDASGQPTNARGLLGLDDVTVTLTNNEHSQPGTYAIGWVDPVMSVGSLNNYAFVAGDGALNIRKAISGLTIAISDSTVMYDGLAHRLSYTVSAPEGCDYQVAYSTDNGATYTDVGEDGLLPASIAAGTYPIKVRITSPYYVDGYVDTDQATLNISRRPLNITSESDTFVYDKAEHSVQALWQVTASSALAGLLADPATGMIHRISAYDFENEKGNTQTDVGSHDVLVKQQSVVVLDQDNADVTANYQISTSAGQIAVTQQASVLGATTRTVGYDAAAQSFTLPELKDANGDPVSETVAYQFSTDGINWHAIADTYTQVNTAGYVLHVRAVSRNYQTAETTATLYITAAEITVTADTNNSFYYTLDKDGNPKEWSIKTAALTEGTLYGGATLVYTLDNNTQSDVGSHEVGFSTCQVMLGDVDVSENYLIHTVNGSIGVVQGTAEAVIAADNLTETYNGLDHTLAQPTISVKTEDDSYADKTDAYRIVYSATLEGSDETWTFTDELPHFVNAGVYHITISATSKRLATPEDATATLTIQKKPVTLTSGDNRLTPYTYLGTEQTVDAWLTTAAESLAIGDTVSDYTFAAGLGNASVNVCDHAVLLDSVVIQNAKGKNVTPNYAISFTPGYLMIQPLTVSGGLNVSGDDSVYDGGEHTITLNDTLTTEIGNFSLSGATGEDGAARFSVQYTTTPYGGVEGAKTTAKPTFLNVSEQTVTIYMTDASGNLVIRSGSAQVNITPRDVTITPAGGDWTYDGQPHTATGYSNPKATMNAAGVAMGTTGLVGSDAVTVTLQNNGPHTLPGEYAITWVNANMSTGSADNYNFLHDTGVMTIAKATGIGLTLTADNNTYDGTAYGYSATPNVPDGCLTTLEYRNQTGDWVEVTAGNPLPSYINAGEYPLTVRVSSPYFSDTAEKTVTLSISRREITLAAGDNSATPYTYDGTEQSVTAARLTAGTIAAGDRLDLATATYAAGLNNVGTDVCDRAVALSGITILNSADETVNANYLISWANGRIVIRQAGSQTAPESYETTYAGMEYVFHQPAFTDDGGTPIAGATYDYSLTNLSAEDANWMPFNSAVTRENVLRNADGTVASYRVYIRITHPNYQTQITTSTLKINPAAITVTADTDDTFTYTLDADGNPIPWSIATAQLTYGTLYKGAAIHYTLTDNTQSVLGEHDVLVDTCQVTFGAVDYTDNYAITKAPGHITVSKGTAATKITAAGDTVTYNGDPHGISAPIVAVKNENDVYVNRTQDFTLSYQVSLTGTTQTWTYDDVADIAFVNAGTYQIVVSATSDLHAAPAPDTVTLIIDRRPLTITSESNADYPYTYNGAEQSVLGDERVQTLVAGHTLASLTYETGMENVSTDVCNHAVLLSSVQVMDGATDVTDNYTIQFNPGKLVIEALPISASLIGITGVTTVYDGLPHSVTLPQTIQTTVGSLNLEEEFTVTYQVNQSPDATGILPLTITNAATGGENPEFYDVGQYDVTVSLHSLSGNYAPAPGSASVIITPKPLKISYGTLSVSYDGGEHAVDRAVEGLTARDAMTISDQDRASTDATRKADGSFGALTSTAQSWNITDASDPAIDRNDNYTVTVSNGSLEIKPLSLTVEVISETHEYDAALHTLTGYDISGAILAGQEEVVTLSGNSAVNVVNKQPVTVAGVVIRDSVTHVNRTGNYRIATQDGTLTITPKPLRLLATTTRFAFDGQPHAPEAYVSEGLQGTDRLSGYAFMNMPKYDVGNYRDVKFNPDMIVLLNVDGDDVTGNYDISYGTGELQIYAVSTTYTVRYYYDGVQDGSITRVGTSGQTVTTYTSGIRDGYVLDHTENLPLRLVSDSTANVIRVYYRKDLNLLTLYDLDIPLGGGSGCFETGFTIE